MCTVVFIPANDSYFFASLRDENPERTAATIPAILTNSKVKYLSPADAVAGGTWVGVNELGVVIILLNGGFENHQRKNYYRKSRGLIVNDLLKTKMPVDAWDEMDMEDIEPYTLIVWNGRKLFQLIWDGATKHQVTLASNTPHIWSSATLYNTTAAAYRKNLFQKWIVTNPPVSDLSLLDFFRSYTDNENGFIMNRAGHIKTLSYSVVELSGNSNAVMNYYDLQNFSCNSKKINFIKHENSCIDYAGDIIQYPNNL